MYAFPFIVYGICLRFCLFIYILSTDTCFWGCAPCRCTQIKTYSWDNAQVVLVGNKCDLEEERVVSTERGKQLADHLGKRSPYFHLQYFPRQEPHVKVSNYAPEILAFTEGRLLLYMC